MPAQITACYDRQSRYFAAEVLRVLRTALDIRNIYVNEYGHVFTNSTNTAVLLSEDGDIGLLVEAIQLDQGSPLLQTSNHSDIKPAAAMADQNPGQAGGEANAPQVEG
jgi:hypothetical protein